MLIQCVRNHKVDLMDVPLTPICQAYFEYLLQIHNTDLDMAASAVVPLAYLLERKAFLLLPIEPEIVDEFDGDEPLAPEPYAHEFAAAVETLRIWQDERERTFFRTSRTDPNYELPFEFGETGIQDLALVLERLLKRALPEQPDALRRPRRSLAEQMDIVARSLPSDFTPLEQIIVDPFTRQEVIWWFLALLELIRLGQAQFRVEGDQVLFAGGVACSA